MVGLHKLEGIILQPGTTGWIIGMTEGTKQRTEMSDIVNWKSRHFDRGCVHLSAISTIM